jgi:hypothetical protein
VFPFSLSLSLPLSGSVLREVRSDADRLNEFATARASCSADVAGSGRESGGAMHFRPHTPVSACPSDAREREGGGGQSLPFSAACPCLPTSHSSLAA